MAPTAGRPGNRVFSSSFPRTITLRLCVPSSSFSQRPSLSGKKTDLVQLGLGAQDFAAGVGEFADFVQVGAGKQRDRHCGREEPGCGYRRSPGR